MRVFVAAIVTGVTDIAANNVEKGEANKYWTRCLALQPRMMDVRFVVNFIT